MCLMSGRGHQLCGAVGKHFGASDFEAGPAQLDRCDRTIDSRCDDGGLLVDGDQMGLHGLETTDGAPELLTFAAVAQCHCRVTGLIGEVGSAADDRAARLGRRPGCEHHDAVDESDDVLGAVTPRHGRHRAEQPIIVETERGSGRQYRTNPLGQRETGGRVVRFSRRGLTEFSRLLEQ